MAETRKQAAERAADARAGEECERLAALLDTKRAAGGSIRLRTQEAEDMQAALFDAACLYRMLALPPAPTPSAGGGPTEDELIAVGVDAAMQAFNALHAPTPPSEWRVCRDPARPTWPGCLVVSDAAMIAVQARSSAEAPLDAASSLNLATRIVALLTGMAEAEGCRYGGPAGACIERHKGHGRYCPPCRAESDRRFSAAAAVPTVGPPAAGRTSAADTVVADVRAALRQLRRDEMWAGMGGDGQRDLDAATGNAERVIVDLVARVVAEKAPPSAPDAGRRAAGEALDAAVERVRALGGCGDNSCWLVLPGERRGPGTNGGCRCKDRPMVFQSLANVYRAALAPSAGGAAEVDRG